MAATNHPTNIAIRRALNTLLEKAYWPETIRMGTYTRRHDDTDGERGADQDLTVMISADGDAWVAAAAAGFLTLRFRNLAGGGQSHRVHRALLILAEAIRRDNEEHPQSR